LSQKSVFEFTTEYLNKHFLRKQEDQNKRIILTKEDLTCKAYCGEPLKRGDWIYSKPLNGKVKRYHLKCAFRLLLLTSQEAQDLTKKTAIKATFVIVMAVWATEISRQALMPLI